jgi:hypothetical protein
MRDDEYDAMLERDHKMLLGLLVVITIALVVQSVWG